MDNILNEINGDLTIIFKELGEVERELGRSKIKPFYFNKFVEIKNKVNNLNIEIFNNFLQLELLQKDAEEIKKDNIMKVIAELENRENDIKPYKNINEELYNTLSQFDGQDTLLNYLSYITQNQEYPLNDVQLINYIWQLIKIDVCRYRDNKKSVLEEWTNDTSYTMANMLNYLEIA